jgi:hypothetical protein
MKKHLLVLLMLIVSTTTFAQTRLISGEIFDKSTQDPIMQATVQLLKKDSTFIIGAISNEDGLFTITAPDNGDYLLKISSIGYKSLVRKIKVVDDKNLSMGKIPMTGDSHMLKGVTVTGQAAKVVLKEDTFVYNSSAYRTPEGSTVEELVKRLPGAEVSDDGTITINGKTVKKILVDGKEFMTGDTKTALKNLPTSIVDKIKAYDEKSDLARITGIDDGEESTVLDFGMKKGMNKGMISNIDLSLGTDSRYSEKLMAGIFQDNNRFMLFGSANNVNDMGFPGGGGRGRFGSGRDGLTATKMIGANYNYELKNKLKLDASLRWNHSDGDAYTKSAIENFVGSSAYENKIAQNYTRSNSWNGNMRLEWKPDSMTNIMFRPSFSWSTSDSRSHSFSAAFLSNPYLKVADPLSTESIISLAKDSAIVNTQEDNSISYSKTNNVKGMLQYNRKLNNMGRNFTLRADASYGKTDSESLSTNAAHLYLVQAADGLDSTYQTNRYNVTPSKNYSYSLQATYSEPLWRATFLQFSYKFTYNLNKSDRSTYDFSNLGENFFADVTPAYRGWDSYLSKLANPYTSYLDDELSRSAEYKNYIHEINVMMRLIRQKYQLNFGVMVQPQSTKFTQDYQGVHVDTVRTVTNFSPTFDFRYRFSKVSNLRINYRGTTSQPSMTDLLDITDDSNPLNITKGNPGLKPSFTNKFRLFYNNYIQAHQRAIMANVNFSTTRNSISSKVTYDALTGGRTTQPENINGNWDANGVFMFNTAIDSTGFWNVNTFTNVGYNNYVGYLTLDQTSDSQKNTTRTLTLNERLAGSYRNEWLEIELDGSVRYIHARNKLQSSSDLDTWQFAYGATVNITLPWGMSLSTDLHENSRRGYDDASMNTNELVWNAQLAQSFLKGKPLSVTLQFYDILKQQSNLSRTINATRRSDVEYNSINSYAMLHVIYRMNLFGSKEARNAMNRGDRPDRPDFGDKNFQGGRPRGNFGGNGGGGFGGPR